MPSDQNQITDRQYLEAIYASVEKTRKYILWMNIITIAFFVIPLIIGVFSIPFILHGFNSYFGALQQ